MIRVQVISLKITFYEKPYGEQQNKTITENKITSRSFISNAVFTDYFKDVGFIHLLIFFLNKIMQIF